MRLFLHSPSARRQSRLSLCLVGCAGLVLSVAAARSRLACRAPRIVRARYLMGTILEIDAAASRRSLLEGALSEAFEEVAHAEARLSNWREDSELSRVNRKAGAAPVPLSPRTFWSLDRALELARETQGAFDPTVGSVTEALGLTGGPADPARAELARSSIGWQKALLDPSRRTLTLIDPRTALDSGGFGKGEALDRALMVLRKRGVTAARANFGGQISTYGTGTREGRGAGFDRVAAAAPDSSGREICLFTAGDGSVSTSGDSERPGHLIDPRTGRAASFHGSVTVLSDTGLRADALSTALFVLGPVDGLAFADRRGIPALFVSRDGAILRSRAFPRCSSEVRSRP